MSRPGTHGGKSRSSAIPAGEFIFLQIDVIGCERPDCVWKLTEVGNDRGAIAEIKLLVRDRHQ